MTFIELFAWLAEMQLYQLNRVTERHRLSGGFPAGREPDFDASAKRASSILPRRASPSRVSFFSENVR